MCSPKAPKTPNPTVVANAQRDANIATAQNQTELNRYNEVNPLGSQLWTRDPNNPNSYTLNTQYDPRILANINGQLDYAGNVGNFGKELNNRTADLLRKPLSTAPNAQDALGYVDAVDRRLYDNDSNVRSSMGTAARGDAALADTIGDFNRLQNTSFNFNNAPNMPTSNEATRTAMADAIYNRQASRLDPQYQQRDSDLNSRLAAQGITQGSDAYNRELDNLMRDRNDAYANARNDAEIGSQNAVNSQFANQLAARGQGVNEANLIRDQASEEALVANQLAGGANQNAVNQMGSQINRGLAVPAIANGIMDAQLKGLQGEDMQRNQAMNESNNVYNMYKGLSNPISSNNLPQFTSGMGGAGSIGQTPIADSVYNSYSGDMNRYNANVGSQNNMMSGLAGLGGAALMAPAGTFTGMGTAIMAF